MDGRADRMLNIVDEYIREVLVIRVKRKLNSVDVIDALTNLFILRGAPSSYGPITDPNTLPPISATGSKRQAPKRLT